VTIYLDIHNWNSLSSTSAFHSS